MAQKNPTAATELLLKNLPQLKEILGDSLNWVTIAELERHHQEKSQGKK